MNTPVSPAPGAGLFNLGNNKRNAANGFGNLIGLNNSNSKNNGAGLSGASFFGIAVFVVLIVLVFFFWSTIQIFFHNAYEIIRGFFGGSQVQPPNPQEAAPTQPPVTEAPVKPQEEPVHKTMVEKVLPGHKEVFNISKNAYTYYDAEPLCKALGAELATYEQVKNAFEGGADWCNYGWTKGQMAVYPTQKETWEHIQEGPEDQRNACGRPGVNGGQFDNPELRFGVNCYGAKPEQTSHDATEVTSGKVPLSPAQLDFEKKVNKFRTESNYISILPFNTKQWGS